MTSFLLIQRQILAAQIIIAVLPLLTFKGKWTEDTQLEETGLAETLGYDVTSNVDI